MIGALVRLPLAEDSNAGLNGEPCCSSLLNTGYN